MADPVRSFHRRLTVQNSGGTVGPVLGRNVGSAGPALIGLLLMGACRPAPAGAEPTEKPESSTSARVPPRPGDPLGGSLKAWNACARSLSREEVELPTRAGPIFAMRVAGTGPVRGAVVFTHGAGSPGSATWDLTPDSHSALRAFACAGYDAYAFDVRGFGGSHRPPEMELDPKGPPAVRGSEAAQDLTAVVDWARERSRVDRVDVVGWSWGCVVAGLYATQPGAKVRRMALFAPVFDRKLPSRHIRDVRWREETRALHKGLFREELEDRQVHAAFVKALFRFDEDGVLRLPNGPYRDLYGPDAPVWDPARVRAPTLVVRGGRDRASQRDAALRLVQRLPAGRRRYVELPDAGHFVFRRHGHRDLYAELLAFMSQAEP